MKKQNLLLLLSLIYMISSTLTVLAVSDREILSDPVANIYKAGVTSESITTNMQFTDVSGSHWAKEPITRLGALEVVKGGYNEGNVLSYRPEQSVSNQETLAFFVARNWTRRCSSSSSRSFGR